MPEDLWSNGYKSPSTNLCVPFTTTATPTSSSFANDSRLPGTTRYWRKDVYTLLWRSFLATTRLLRLLLSLLSVLDHAARIFLFPNAMCGFASLKSRAAQHHCYAVMTQERRPIKKAGADWTVNLSRCERGSRTQSEVLISPMPMQSLSLLSFPLHSLTTWLKAHLDHPSSQSSTPFIPYLPTLPYLPTTHPDPSPSPSRDQFQNRKSDTGYRA